MFQTAKSANQAISNLNGAKISHSLEYGSKKNAFREKLRITFDTIRAVFTLWFPRKPKLVSPQLSVEDVDRTSVDLPEEIATHFSIYKANGGFVVVTKKSDPQTERWRRSLYVSTTQEGLAEDVAQILLLERLRQ